MFEVSPILEAVHVSKTYSTRRKNDVRAVVEVSVEALPGVTVGLIGQSGSGKTTLTRMLLGLEMPTSGAVYFRGKDLRLLDGAGRADFRRSVTAVFQNPYGSLNPRMRIWNIVTEQLAIEKRSAAERRQRSEELLDLVGFPAEVGDRYPHQLSGGQRQRVAIARSLAARPEVVVLDEPLSALDVSVQAQIVNLLVDLQQSLGLAYVFVGHDLAIARQLCDRIIVMNGGHVVEEGPAMGVLLSPVEDYTIELVRASELSKDDVSS